VHAIMPGHLLRAAHVRTARETKKMATHKAVAKAKQAFDVSAEQGYLEMRWRDRPDFLKKSCSMPLNMVEREMLELTQAVHRRAMGGRVLRVAPNGVRTGSAVRTLHLLHDDPMARTDLNPKVVDRLTSPTKAKFGPTYMLKPGLREELQHQLEVDFSLKQSERLKDFQIGKDSALAIDFSQPAPRPAFASGGNSAVPSSIYSQSAASAPFVSPVCTPSLNLIKKASVERLHPWNTMSPAITPIPNGRSKVVSRSKLDSSQFTSNSISRGRPRRLSTHLRHTFPPVLPPSRGPHPMQQARRDRAV